MPALNTTAVTKYRLDIDPEFQGWILIFATLQVVFNFMLPCYCAGSSTPSFRRFAHWLSQRLPAFYVVMAAINAVFMFLVITWLPDYGYADYVKALTKFMAYAIGHLVKSIDSIVIILAAVFAIAFKDRIALVLGLDHKTLFRFKTRDCLTCWSSNSYQAVELVIWKVEDLMAGDLFTANNVFVEVSMGFNEEMKTRVHNNAGAACILKETLQMNWDEEDDEEKLLLQVKNQKLVGAAELARLHLDAEQLKKVRNDSIQLLPAGKMPTWAEAQFVKMDMMPRGTIWFRLSPVDDETYSHGNLVQDLTTC